jgi:hypothetical protein
MKKILFILLLACTFAACSKEEEKYSTGGVTPIAFRIYPDTYTAEAGTVIKVKTPVPTVHFAYYDELPGVPAENGMRLNSTNIGEDNPMSLSFPYTYENEYYSLIQTDVWSYEITVKELDKPCKFGLRFGVNDCGIPLGGGIMINYVLSE